mgnify:CR=1 FL=1
MSRDGAVMPAAYVERPKLGRGEELRYLSKPELLEEIGPQGPSEGAADDQ